MSLVPQREAGVLSLSEHQQARILKALGIDPSDPISQALLLVADRYDLDPLLKQVQIINRNVYITHAGLLHIAHASGQLDGIVVEEQSSGNDGWYAKVTVYRRDMTHGFTYEGYFAKSRVRQGGASGREMALKNAERAAIRRAFDITAPTMDETGVDIDAVEIQGDISLPDNLPQLPSAEDNDIPVPGASNVIDLPAPPPLPPAPPEDVDVTTGEVIEGLTNMQERARAIAAEAEEKLDEKLAEEGKPKRTRRTKAQIEADKKAEADRKRAQEEAEARLAAEQAAAEEQDEDEPDDEDLGLLQEREIPDTEEASNRARRLHIAATDADIDEQMLDDLIDWITYGSEAGPTTSAKAVDQDEEERLLLIMDGIKEERIEVRYAPDGTIHLHPGEPVNWKKIVKVHNLTDAKLLRQAREIASRMNWPLPGRLAEIQGEELEKALMLWIEGNEQ